MKPTRQTPPDRHPFEPNTPNSEGPEWIDPRWAWHRHTLLRLRDRLMHAHYECSTQAAIPPDRRGIDADETPRDEVDRDVWWTALGHEDDKLFEIDAALSRIHEGTYGFCELTGAPIPEERLRAIPWTRYSVTAAKTIERPPKMRSGL